MPHNSASVFNKRTRGNSLFARFVFAAASILGLVGTAVAQQADPRVTIAGPASAVAGQTVSYTVTINNGGPGAADQTAYNVTFNPALTNLVIQNCVPSNGAAACPAIGPVGGDAVNGAVMTLPPGGGLLLDISGTVPATNQQPIQAQAFIGTPPTFTDTNPGNNQATANMTVPVALQRFSVD